MLSLIVYKNYINIPPGSWNWGKQDTQEISWIPFQWTSDSLSGRYFEKSAIFVNIRLDDIPDTLACQLDLGSNMTILYQNPMKRYTALNSKTFFYREHLFGGKKHACVKDTKWKLGNVSVSSPSVILYEHYGDTTTTDSNIKIGTIGVDMFQDKVLTIDFPNQQFCVSDEIQDNSTNFIPIELSSNGFIILPLKIGNKRFKCLYDSGSSLFSIITYPGHVANFSGQPDNDSFTINSWGKQVMVYSRGLNAETIIMGHSIPNEKVYTLNTVEDFLKESKADAILGNALFWNNTIIIDFKHKRFGIR